MRPICVQSPRIRFFMGDARLNSLQTKIFKKFLIIFLYFYMSYYDTIPNTPAKSLKRNCSVKNYFL